MSERSDTYLGDAVYASFDGYQVWLRTGDGNNQAIALEPPVLAALARYVDNICGAERNPLRATSDAAPASPPISDAMRERIVAVLTPFATFIKGADFIPDESPVTAGSSMAKRQLTASDLRKAAALLAELTATGGE